ncbi:hypothetical protein [Cronobacter phage JC01]|uniref:DUF5983 domain-containing protein n=1 Tax=Cronobacter phage JC01 TaxID=2729575 RepID=A0A6M3YLN1_9CAUD|nr:hypothetical protein JT331_gp70 [Cronobacter phage JC01]QJI52259.1 hypothetical protein [Cronobacter phage JC01]
MRAISLSESASYRVLYTSLAHVSPADLANLKSMCEAGYYFVHNVENDFSGIICRYGAVTPESDVGEVMIGDYGFSESFGEMIAQFKDAGFDAVHFDVDGDLVEGVTWYTENNTRVQPIAYGCEILTWWDLAVEHQLTATDEYGDDGDADLKYFLADGVLYCLDNFMRVTDGEMQEMGFHASAGESNGSAICITLSDNSDFVDVARVS